MAISNNISLQSDINGFAKFFNLNPFYFNYIDTSCIQIIDDVCLEFWSQNAYVSNGLSIELLASLLYQAEEEVKLYYGLTLGEWIIGEEILYPAYTRHGDFVTPIITDVKLKTKYPVKFFGQRKFTELATISIIYSGSDYNTVGRITYNVPNVVDYTKIKFYYPDHIGENGYELKSYKIVSYTNNVLIVEFDAYNLVKLDVINKHTFSAGKAHDLCGDIYLSTIGIGYEERDTCLPDIKLYYSDICNDDQCVYEHIPACGIKLTDRIFKLAPKSYDEEGCVTDSVCNIYYPKIVSVNYYSESEYKKLIQTAIYYIAASRFPLQNCQCDCVKSTFNELQVDILFKPKNDGAWIAKKNDYNSPFGTRIGELKAYYLLDSLLNN